MDNLPKQRWSRRLSTRPRPGDFALGSLESRAAARAVQLVLDIEAQEQRAALFRNLTPLEQAFIEGDDDPGAQAWGVYLVRNAIIPKCQLFGWPLPTPEEVRHKRQVSEEVEKFEQERAALGAGVSETEDSSGNGRRPDSTRASRYGPDGTNEQRRYGEERVITTSIY
jgi:hypothetical protein